METQISSFLPSAEKTKVKVKAEVKAKQQAKVKNNGFAWGQTCLLTFE